MLQGYSFQWLHQDLQPSRKINVDKKVSDDHSKSDS